MSEPEKTTRLGLGFKQVDIDLIQELKRKLEVREGPTTNIAVIRRGLRVLAAQLKRVV
jgi:uncharacterized protein YjhX (UPF0386 family)